MPTVYFAGPLFTHSELLANAHLARAINHYSDCEFICRLPQNIECMNGRDALQIRNDDLNLLYRCDMAIFNFNGTEIDSGTLVEYMQAKQLDKPCVIYRTDLRAGRANREFPWNEMATNFPRTETVFIQGMYLYRQYLNNGVLDHRGYIKHIALQLIEALRKVQKSEPVITTPQEYTQATLLTMRLTGGGMIRRMNPIDVATVDECKHGKDRSESTLKMG